jgi:hypothetical protein
MTMGEFNPREHLGEFKGRAYMDVAHRLLWLNADVERYDISTEYLALDEQRVIARATVTLYAEDGSVRRRAIGHGSSSKATVPSFVRVLEKAETAAVGRALGMLGYGTQYAQEFDDADDDHLADSPAPGRTAQAAAPPTTAAPSAGTGGARAVGGTRGPLSADQAAAWAATGEPPSATETAAAPASPDPRGKGLHHAPDGELWALKRFYERCARELQLERGDVLARLGTLGLKEAMLQRNIPCQTVASLEQGLPRLYDELAQAVADERERPALKLVDAEEA